MLQILSCWQIPFWINILMVTSPVYWGKWLTGKANADLGTKISRYQISLFFNRKITNLDFKNKFLIINRLTC